MNRIVRAALLACVAAAPVWADTLELESGVVLEGEVERRGEWIWITLPNGASARFSPGQVIQVTETPCEQAAPAAPAQASAPVVVERPIAVAQPAVARRRDAAAETVALASSIRRSLERGWRGQAERLIAAHENARSWDALGRAARVKSTYDGHRLQVEVLRPSGTTEDLVVAFTPGTYGRESRGEQYQDLVFLRAPVVVIPAGQSRTQVSVPVACARYGWATPRANLGYALDRVPEGSDLDQLLVHLCAGREPTPEEASQLAVWIVRNKLSPTQFEERHTTFESARPILRQHGRDAANLIELSGSRSTAYPFFGGDAPSAAGAPEPPARPVSGFNRFG